MANIFVAGEVLYLHCCPTNTCLQVGCGPQHGVTHTSRISMVHFLLLIGEGGLGGRVCAVACVRCSRNKDDDGSIGVQVHTGSRGGDLGHRGHRRDEPAICFGPQGSDPASLFSLLGTLGSLRGPDLSVWDHNGESELYEHSQYKESERMNPKCTINFSFIFKKRSNKLLPTLLF